MAEQDNQDRERKGMPSYDAHGFGSVVSKQREDILMEPVRQPTLEEIQARAEALRTEVFVPPVIEEESPLTPPVDSTGAPMDAPAPPTGTIRAPYVDSMPPVYTQSLEAANQNTMMDVVEPVEPAGPDGDDAREPEQTVGRRPFPRKKVGIGVGIALLGILALYTLPIPFGHIEVVGSKQVTVSDVMAAGDISEPVNVLQINSTKLADRLQRDLRVETAKVSYALPATLVVDVKDRQAVAVVQSQFGFAELDRNGQVIQEGPAIVDTSVPIISGIRLGNVLLGDTVDVEAVKAALTYLTKLSPAVSKDIAEINVGDASQLIAYTVSGLPIHLGNTSDLDKKAKLTEEMLSDIQKKGVSAQYIDVNVTSPYIKTNS